jgi:hypothetical protein
MHNTMSVAALMIFAVAPFAALSLKTYATRTKTEESEKAWELVAKFIV